jgi:hypothetical protein
MILSTFSAVLAFATAQAADPTTASRNAYTACLRQFMQRSLESRTSAADFESQLPQQCTEQEAAFRRAVVAREVGFRVPQAGAEQTANEEIEDARSNFRELFAMNSSPN